MLFWKCFLFTICILCSFRSLHALHYVVVFFHAVAMISLHCLNISYRPTCGMEGCFLCGQEAIMTSSQMMLYVRSEHLCDTFLIFRLHLLLLWSYWFYQTAVRPVCACKIYPGGSYCLTWSFSLLSFHIICPWSTELNSTYVTLKVFIFFAFL